MVRRVALALAALALAAAGLTLALHGERAPAPEAALSSDGARIGPVEAEACAGLSLGLPARVDGRLGLGCVEAPTPRAPPPASDPTPAPPAPSPASTSSPASAPPPAARASEAPPTRQVVRADEDAPETWQERAARELRRGAADMRAVADGLTQVAPGTALPIASGRESAREDAAGAQDAARARGVDDDAPSCEACEPRATWERGASPRGEGADFARAQEDARGLFARMLHAARAWLAG